MTNQEIQQVASEYANKHWAVIEKPNEHDNSREDFIAGARWAAGEIEKELVELTTMLDQIINACTDDQLDKAIRNAQKRLKL